MTEPVLTITIDGVEVCAQEGQTIMQAADAADIYIPRLCYHPDISSSGHCRLCTVFVHGKPAAACMHPVSQGLVIENDTEVLNAHRRTILEMLFVEGNHQCPTCEASGRCELQAMAYRFGIMAPSLPYLHRNRGLDASHRDVYIDRDRCILCGRCVRASRELDKKNAFGFENRGIHKKIAVNGAEGLSETGLAVTDAVVGMCPTGCLTVKREGYRVPVGQRRYDQTPIGADPEK
jgi:[NiFe] hydrogenase diaphorase moiety small subunit